MVQKKSSKAEKARRKAQSNKDKKGKVQITLPRSVGPSKPKKKTSKKSGSGLDEYARLILDPCNARLVPGHLPGLGGGTAYRVPFRQRIYLPTTTTDIKGQSATGTVNCDTLIASLVPHAMIAGNGPSALTVTTCVQEVTNPIPSAVPNQFSTQFDPYGLSSVQQLSGEMRPAAACIRITCMSPDSSNSGQWFGYEGANRTMLTNFGDKTTSFVPSYNAQQIMLSGKQNGNTLATYEVKMNLPNADPSWTQWRNTLTAGRATATGSVGTGDAADIDVSDMPIAVVGVTGGTPGACYLIDGVIVYDWQPNIAWGIATPAKIPVAAGKLERTAAAVQKVANSWGGMLIGTAANYATGGSAGNVLALAKAGYLALNN